MPQAVPVNTTFVNCLVMLTDPVKCAQLQATYPNGIVGMSPAAAAAAFGAPIGGSSPGGALTPPATLPDPIFASPFGFQVGCPTQTVILGVNLAAVTVNVNDLCFGTPHTVPTTFEWVVYFVLQGTGTTNGPLGNAIATRRWIMGFELPPAGEGISPTDSSNMQNCVSRDASRTSEGFGLAMRSATNIFVVRRLDEYGAALTPGSWERFYLRVRQLHSGTMQFWGSQGGGTGASQDGLHLAINASGQLVTINNSIFGGPATLDTISPALVLNQWYKVDVFVYYAQAPSTPGYYELYLDGVLASSKTVALLNSGFGGLGRPQNHNSTAIGDFLNIANTLEIDIDDWHNAVPPVQTAIAAFKTTTNGIEWTNGSHMRRVKARGLDAAGSWTGDWRETLETPASGSVGQLTSVTGGDQYSVTTDAEAQSVAQGAVQVGTAGYVAGLLAHAGVGGGSGTVGVVGALQAIAPAQTSANQFGSAIVTESSPTDITALKLAHARGSVGGTAGLGFLSLVAEYLGVFRPEDIPPGDKVTRTFPNNFRHNAPFPESQWALATSPVAAEVSIAGGTFTGNGTGQDIATLDPPHWIWIRPLSAPAGGARWIATTNVAQKGGETTSYADGMVDAFAIASSGAAASYGFRVSGGDSQANANGVVYQYMAFCDPGIRYCCAGASRHTTAQATAVNPLDDAAFIYFGAFLHLVSLNNPGARGLWYKGPGHVAEGNGSATPINAVAEQTSVADFGVGSLTTYANMHDGSTGSAEAYIGFQVVDRYGSANVVVQIVSYTGDGTGQRNINLTPVSGKYPMWALVTPHSGTLPCVMRDPSHTSTNSSNADTLALVADGIVGGAIDQITVHSDYNSLGIVYDVFVFPGCPGASGAFQNGVCVVAPPLVGPPTGPFGPFPTPTPPVPGPPPPPPGPPTPPPLPGACTAPILGAGT